MMKSMRSNPNLKICCWKWKNSGRSKENKDVASHNKIFITSFVVINLELFKIAFSQNFAGKSSSFARYKSKLNFRRSLWSGHCGFSPLHIYRLAKGLEIVRLIHKCIALFCPLKQEGKKSHRNQTTTFISVITETITRSQLALVQLPFNGELSCRISRNPVYCLNKSLIYIFLCSRFWANS